MSTDSAVPHRGPFPLPAKIAPSLLSCDFAFLSQESDRMIKLGADWLHVDIMDGHFVDNLTIGPPVVAALRKHTDAFLDCHLMVSKPEKWIEDFAKAGATSCTFHIETSADPAALIKKMRDLKLRVGVTLRPSTALESILPFLSLVDLVLVMSVEPGFGGQSFMEDQMVKVREVRKLYPDLDIEVDGGVTVDNIEIVAKAGANVIVSGSGIFKAKEPQEAIQTMKKVVNEHRQKDQKK